jgi:hypothetical protein
MWSTLRSAKKRGLQKLFQAKKLSIIFFYYLTNLVRFLYFKTELNGGTATSASSCPSPTPLSKKLKTNRETEKIGEKLCQDYPVFGRAARLS